jgi:2-hydroxy-3-oxopropionate reductase
VTVIGFVGLGVMGAPMAANLVRAGFDVVGFNRSPAKIEKLVSAGGRAARSVAEAADGADVVVTMLPDSPDVEAAALGEHGVFAHAKPGALFIDASTSRPDVARSLAAAGAERGIGVLDAPVSGGEQGAIDATLSIMVGGEAETFQQA